VEQFLDVFHMTAGVDGVPLPDVMSHWGPVHEVLDRDDDGDMDYRAFWQYPLGVLDPGTYDIASEWTLSEAITDGLDLDGDGQPDEYSGSWTLSVILEVGEGEFEGPPASDAAKSVPANLEQAQEPAQERTTQGSNSMPGSRPAGTPYLPLPRLAG